MTIKNTNANIAENEKVLKILEALKNYNVTIEIARVSINGKTAFGWKATMDGKQMKGLSDSPEHAAKDLKNAYVDAIRKDNKKKDTKRRKGNNIPKEDEEFADVDEFSID